MTGTKLVKNLNGTSTDESMLNVPLITDATSEKVILKGSKCCYDPFSFLYLLILSCLSYLLILSDIDLLSRSYHAVADMQLPCIYLDPIAQPSTCIYLALYLTIFAQSPTCDYLMLYMLLPCVRHAFAMSPCTYIPSYLVVCSLASYCLLESLLLLS